SSNNSFARLDSSSSSEEIVNPSTSTQNQPLTDELAHERIRSIWRDLHGLLHSHDFSNLLNGPLADSTASRILGFLDLIEIAAEKYPILSNWNTSFAKLTALLKPLDSTKRADASVSTEPIPAPPLHKDVACTADIAPTPSAQPPIPSPSPKPGPRPPQPPMPKKAHPLTSRPRSHQVRPNVRFVACIAGRADALTSATPRWKEVPTDCFSSLSKDLKAAAPGCTPLRFHCNQKGNLIITFAPTASRSLLTSTTVLNIVRGNFELAFHVPILFDTPRSTLHLTHVPARSQDGSPIFDQSALAESILANPALSTLPLTSPPRWLRHPSQITGIRSSAVLTFEDPDGAIIQQLLKTPFFVFGQPVTVKPWINKPPIIARHPREGSNRDHAPMDI
ncbi:hypothetical protein FRC11_011839, partial [Ceratobasidium sp. 423]